MLKSLQRPLLIFISFVLMVGIAFEINAQQSQPENSFGKTLEDVLSRGFVICGIKDNAPGFGVLIDENNANGFDVDFCNAIASAIFGEVDDRVKYVSAETDRFEKLSSGEIDVLIRTTTWNISRDTDEAANFTNITFYDGQGFAVNKKTRIRSLENLRTSNISIGVRGNTTTFENLQIWYQGSGKIEEFESDAEMAAAFGDKNDPDHVDAITSDKSSLPGKLENIVSNSYRILDGEISKEPLGAVVRHGDDEWFDIIKWTIYATIIAEEEGITKNNIENFEKDQSNNGKLITTQAKRLLGLEGDRGEKLGLSNDCFFNIIKSVGNYGEIFDRNLNNDEINISRGKNNLSNSDTPGLQYSPPL